MGKCCAKICAALPNDAQLNLMKELRVDGDLTLSVLREGDIEELAEAVQRNLEHLGPWQVWAVKDYGTRHAEEFITLNLANTDPKSQAFGIFLKGRLIGCTGFVPREEFHIAEIGYWIDKEEQGKGFVTRVAHALTDYVFMTLGVSTVEIRAAALNLRSRAVAERLKFELIERRKDAHPLPNGIVDDLVIYAMQKRNW